MASAPRAWACTGDLRQRLMSTEIRTIAVALCTSGERVLVERGYDGVRNHHFYRAIGGGVEPGERPEETLMREWREELGLTLDAPELLGVVANLFTYEGRTGHEIVFVFGARITDAAAYEQDELEGTDTEGARHTAVWVTRAQLRTGPTPLYPAGVLDLLRDRAP